MSVRVTTLGEEEKAIPGTAGERLEMVWPLTVAAWTFKDGTFAPSRLPRHLVHIERRER
jgi:hypothetical protein